MENKDIYCKRPDIVLRKIGKEVVLIPIKNNIGDLQNIYTINQAGAFIYEAIDGVNTIGEIGDLLSQQYCITREQAQNDLLAFIKELEDSSVVFTPCRSETSRLVK